MKIEIELPDVYKNDKMVLCTQDNPTVVAYFNIFDEGDIWIKTKGCEGCPWESRQLCCRGCPMNTEQGCLLHLQRPEDTNKPFSCVTLPEPVTTLSYCQIEFECIGGKNRGKKRRIKEPCLEIK